MRLTPMKFWLVPSLAATVAFAAIADRAMAQGAIDACIKGVDALAVTASQYGLVVSDTARAGSVATSCESAEQQAPQSPSLKLATARALIWAGREDAALVRIEQFIDTDQGAADLAAGLCALGTGSARVLQTSCGWLVAHPPADKAVAVAAARRLLQAGDGETGLAAMGIAARLEDASAVSFVADSCKAFDPVDLPAITRANPAFASLDPAYVAALTCEAAYTSLPADTPDWATSGFNFVTAMTYFDDYASAGGALLELAESGDSATAKQAIDLAVGLCAALAGDPQDQNIGTLGLQDHEIIIHRALPICEVAAYTAPNEGAMHYNLYRVYKLNGDLQSSNDAFLAARDLQYPLAVGSSNGGGGQTIAGGGGATLPSSGQIDFDRFNRPDWIRAFHSGDMTVFENEDTDVMLYLMALLKEFNDPAVWYRAGTEFQLIMDPQLLPALNGLAVTDSRLMTDLGNKGFEAIIGLLGGIGQERIRQQNENRIDPGAEIAAGTKGVLDVITPFTVLKNQATQDGIRLIALYTQSPSDFESVYSGIRKFVYNQ